jgi:hypothetical protein
MMQALEQGLGSLRFAVHTWLLRLGWRRESSAVASQRLARDLGLPADKVHDILDHAFSELRELSDDDADPWPIIDRALQEIEQLDSLAAQEPRPPRGDGEILHDFNDVTLEATVGNATQPTGGEILTRH